MLQHEQSERRQIDVTGIVQGIGFRPFVFRLAQELQLTGFVRNHSAGVTIEIEGRPRWLGDFVARLSADAPALARIDTFDVQSVPVQNSREFQIIESTGQFAASTPISPDVAVCDECLAEMRDPGDRRFGYAFINCTNCGPRFTIVRDIPYDRPLTTMAAFEMCAACAAEYREPTNRRFHAQPNACPLCGPHIWFVTAEDSGHNAADAANGAMRLTGASAVEAFQAGIQEGMVVAVKGIGGFHLACDAADDEAVLRLRERKGRIEKPFAIMVADVEAARRVARVNEQEARLLTSPQRPVVLLRRRSGSTGVSPFVAPGNDHVGVMLPYSPLHHLLISEHAALVMTSGNLSEEPIVRTNEEAVSRLAGLADAFLLHNREIHVVCDDSVVRVCGEQELPIRRSRGYAPLPIRLTSTGPSVLAVGGELKAAFCVTKDAYAYMSQHLGDMANLETLDAFTRSVKHFRDLFRVQPEAVACDMHPGYLSTRWAKAYAEDAGIPLVEVQHHHSHIAAVRTEHGCQNPVIGICCDGTGYGTDGAIWGGEVLCVNDDGFERRAHLKYVPLPGGDASIKRPYRVALAHLWAAGIEWDDRLPCVEACPAEERAILRQQLERNLNCIPTSSMGRLFDAVASLIGMRHVVSYEAQAAMEMEARAVIDESDETYDMPLTGTAPFQFDPQPLLCSIVDDLRQGMDTGRIAGRFHRSVANVIRELCRGVRDNEGLNTVALSGGVFQNVVLLKLVAGMLENDGFDTLLHRQVPPNDGGIALGQAVIARRQQARITR